MPLPLHKTCTHLMQRIKLTIVFSLATSTRRRTQAAFLFTINTLNLNMHLKRKGTLNQMCQGNIQTKKNTRFLVGSSVIKDVNAELFKTGLCTEATWTRIKHSVVRVFYKRKADKQVPYASLNHLERLSVSEDELLGFHKKLGLCFKRTERICNDKELETENDDELDCCFDTVLRERVQRSKSFSTRRMAICKEIERDIKGDRNTSLLELRKTLVMNNRFKEMGM